MVEGDPKETLPELLRKDEKEGQDGMRLQPVEGLAADIRGADKKERRKKLKTEIYRLLAPMLGCGYDDLRQRQREYQLKKTIRTMTAALLFLSVIAGYIGWQAYQIHQHYWETMIQRSKYLAQTSAELLKKGDRMAAIAVAMEALPAGEEDRSKPYVGGGAEPGTLQLPVYAEQGLFSQWGQAPFYGCAVKGCGTDKSWREMALGCRRDGDCLSVGSGQRSL